MKPYENYLIISDLDGTIIPRGGKVSEANKKAIAAFAAGGGHFGIATGVRRRLRPAILAVWISRHRVSFSMARCFMTGRKRKSW